MRPADFGLIVALSLFFVYVSHRPLWHTDLWGHLAYGRLIAANRAIPATEPLMRLCQGVPFVDFSWLSELLAYGAYDWRGIPALQFLYAGSVTACVGLLAWCSRRKTNSAWAAAFAAGIYVWVDWNQLAIVRPQLAGCVCFAALFAMLVRRVSGFARNVLIAALFAAWVNLHGSFLIGLATLAAFVCGRAVDLLRRTGSLRALRHDRHLRRGFVFLALAGAAVLLNPYGWRIYEAAWQLSSNANLADLVEWKPLRLWVGQGWAALCVSLVLLGLYGLTPRRISTTELLLLVSLGGATLATSRLIVWWGPVAAYYAALHGAAIWKRWRSAHRIQSEQLTLSIPGRFAAVTVCVALLCTPLTAALTRRPPVDLRESLSSATPIDATEFLRTHPPRGPIFNTLEWGDYLLWAGPPGLDVFVASHVHLVPRPVWQDYIRVITLDEGWQQILERHRVNTAVVDDDQHAALADALRADPAWSVVYEDAEGLIFVRRRPL
ncbi:MAG TPA: hypothetical protein VFG04_22115 [Planctomycetaceae bacterium]|nr:hypothetical protein [Planctomycetaceae bacterium]